MDPKEALLYEAERIVDNEMTKCVDRLRFVRELLVNMREAPDISPMVGEDESAIWGGLLTLLSDVTMAYDSTLDKLFKLRVSQRVSDS